MKEKIQLYCNLNTIAFPEKYIALADFIDNHSFSTCIAYNSVDFLVQGIREIMHKNIDDEQFFMIGDIHSEMPIKTVRPYLHAVNDILQDIKTNTLYVIDLPSQIAYSTKHNRDDAVSLLENKNSAFYVL